MMRDTIIVMQRDGNEKSDFLYSNFIFLFNLMND
jgi:hypothetical protein